MQTTEQTTEKTHQTNNGKCLIFGAAMDKNSSGLPCLKFPPVKKNDGDLVIAADGGLKYLEQAGICPDIILGDFDSLGYIPEKKGFPQPVEILTHPVEKDDTDTGLAIKTALSRGFRQIELFGCLGGERFDHSIAALQSLTYAVRNMPKPSRAGMSAAAYGGIEDDGKFLTVIALHNSSIELPPELSGTLSVFAADGECSGVDLVNVYYPLDGYTLTPAFPLGVSNSFIDGKAAKISVKQGTLWIMFRAEKRVFP